MPRRHPRPSPDLAAGRARFDQWRATRKGRARIPEELWDLAVSLARSHGVNRTARALGLDYGRLAKRLGTTVPAKKAAEKEGTLTFVEVSPPAEASSRPSSPRSPHSECVVEFEDRRGSRMTVRASDLCGVDLSALARVFFRKRTAGDVVKSFFGRRG